MITEANIARLFDAICDNWSNGLPGGNWAPSVQYGQLRTWCNYFVSGVAVAMGYRGFTKGSTQSPMSANDMIDFMTDPKNGWFTASGADAQAWANKGALVVAGQKALGHGHVCIIRPGELRHSMAYGKDVPRCANVGKDVFVNRMVSFAFQKEPAYFVLKEPNMENVQ